MNDPNELVQRMTRHGWLASQPRAFATEIIARARPRHYARGDILHREGDAPGGIYGLVRGGLGVVATRRSGEPVLGHILRAGSWGGEGPLMTGGARTLTYRATEPSLVLCVPLAALEDLQRLDPSAARRYGAMTELGVQTATAVITDLLIPNAERRIAATLIRTTGAALGLEPEDPQGFIITQTELGEMANASRHHVNRTLQRFRKAGWIASHYNRIALLDVPALETFAGGEDPPERI